MQSRKSYFFSQAQLSKTNKLKTNNCIMTEPKLYLWIPSRYPCVIFWISEEWQVLMCSEKMGNW